LWGGSCGWSAFAGVGCGVATNARPPEDLLDDWGYDEHGVGIRGGVASIHAARVGAGRRLQQEIETFAGITLDEFNRRRALRGFTMTVRRGRPVVALSLIGGAI
jgi:hypothetical protein